MAAGRTTIDLAAGEPELVEERLGVVLDFLRTLWALDHALQTTSKRMARIHGVTWPQRLVIRLLGRFPGLSAGRLAAVLHVHPSTLTGVLQRLERRRLVRRRADPADRRRALLWLTESGGRYDRGLPGSIEATVETVLAGARPRDVPATRLLLERIAVALDDQGFLESHPARRRSG